MQYGLSAIENKIMTITMDNASSNDNAAKRLMDKIIARKSAKFIPKYFHVRCCAHCQFDSE